MRRWARGDADATYVIVKRRRRWGLAVTGAVAMAVAAVFLLLPRHKPPDFPRGDEAAILAAPPDRLVIWRFAPAPSILVLSFPTLHAQALTLNRAAAFVEKADAPRDRVLDDAGLDATIGHGHVDFDHYYGGHDYRAADLFRFLATADRQRVPLRPEERAVGDLLRQSGAAAMITLPPPGAGLFDAAGRAAILRHELSHGAYFSDPVYAGYVQRFWAAMDDASRAAFRAYLGGKGYDMADDDLMRNETQAYLVFTPDPRLFRPARLAIGETAVLALRRRFVDGMPAGWLRARAGD